MAVIAIVGCVASLVSPVIEIGKCIGPPIKRQFTYLCCFNSNIQSLKDEAKNLEGKRGGLQREVDAAENNAHVIVPEVKTWLENASRLEDDSNKIQGDGNNDCWSISRYLLSKRAVKITGEMKLLVESKFDRISMPPLSAAQVPIPLGTTYHEFQSRKEIEEEIMEALGAKEVRTMGICGMGGVGKTTMAKKIMNRVKEENKFEEICMVVVSQQVDMLKIQGAIVESLGLRLGEETLLARATKLRARLMGTRRILIVLDDVWEKLKLEDLGIPCGNELNEGTTILLTSRNRDVLNKMDVQKIYVVKTLSETEAWFLFKEKAGTCVDDPNLLSRAEKVARECKGLPIALVTVGSALKDNTSIPIWEDALQQLKSSKPEVMTDVIKDVYNPLKLSYTYLESRQAKSLFLLCSLFPEDVNISLEELTWYCMGLRMFEGITNLEQVRNRVFTIVDTLKSRFLLLNGYNELHVRMHDVVRDVAVYIASNEEKEGIVDVKFNSRRSLSEYAFEWASVFSEKKSSLLRMHASMSLRGFEMHASNSSMSLRGFEIKEFSIFKGIKRLNLLSFQYISLKLLPLEIQLLKNLRTLLLYYCTVESLSVVGELLSLEILYCHGCGGFKELPVEIGKLNQLKLLDFSGCRDLRRIPPGVIWNLVELEEFKMIESFSGWELAAAEVQGQERRNACLNEFENLSKLTCLEIEIKDLNLVAEDISFSPSIVKYKIQIGMYDEHPTLFSFRERCMYMQLPREINLGSWVLRFLRSANSLYLKGDGSNYSLDLPQAHSMKSLKFLHCSTVKELVNSTTTSIDDRSKFDVFPILESLSLSYLPNLEAVYDGPVLDQSNSFKNLECLELYNLPTLRHLCKRPNRIVSLDNLRSIRIEDCENLVSLFSFTMANDLQLDHQNPNVDNFLCTQKVFFPMLGSLVLRGLDKLEVIWNAPIPERFNSFKNLRELRLSELPSMTHVWKSLNILLSNLSKIHIDECHKLRSLFSSTMSVDLVLQLERLEIKCCKMMEEVLLNEENQCRTIQFPKLSELRLESLESLTTFSKGIASIEFLVLDFMIISNCPKLMSLLSSIGNNQNSADGDDNDNFYLFCSQKVIFGNLKEISIISCHSIRSLFSSSISEEPVNLKELRIWNCKEMLKVIEDDEEMSCEKPRLLFPSLKKLTLSSLPKLQSFCNWRCDFQFPSLENVYIDTCPLFEQFSSMGSVTTPNLKCIKIDFKEKDVGDLNGAIQLYFEANRRQLISTIEEQTSSDGTNGGWDQKKDLGQDETYRISETDRVLDTLQLYPLNPLNTEADHSEKLGFFRDDYKKTNTMTFTDNGDEEIDHPTLDLRLKL